MADTLIIVIDGSRILSDLESEYEREHSECLNYNHPLIEGEPYCS
jgi:hypothetical protein